jgi:hypothetical protein
MKVRPRFRWYDSAVMVRTALGVLLLIASIAIARAEGPADADNRQALRREWARITFAKGTTFEISNPDLMPTSLADAAARTGCAYKDAIKERPARFIRAENQRLAIVFCRRFIQGSDQIFDLTDLIRPRNLQFPFLAYPDGFGATMTPGAVKWKSDAGVFEADIGSDTCPGALLRHTYRLGQIGSGVSFVIIRVETNNSGGCNPGEWKTMWEAPRWQP